MSMTNRILSFVCALSLTVSTGIARPGFAKGGEVQDVTRTQVVVREHPKTGKPYVSIVPEGEVPDAQAADGRPDTRHRAVGAVPPDPFTGQKKAYIRPDYRMLDPKVKSGDVPYDGPVSDRKKVYVFAASLMTVGTVGGAVGMATAPVAAGTAAGGAGAYVGAGAVVAGTTAAASIAASKKRPWDDDYEHISESALVRSEENEKGEQNG